MYLGQKVRRDEVESELYQLYDLIGRSQTHEEDDHNANSAQSPKCCVRLQILPISIGI